MLEIENSAHKICTQYFLEDILCDIILRFPDPSM